MEFVVECQHVAASQPVVYVWECHHLVSRVQDCQVEAAVLVKCVADIGVVTGVAWDAQVVTCLYCIGQTVQRSAL